MQLNANKKILSPKIIGAFNFNKSSKYGKG